MCNYYHGILGTPKARIPNWAGCPFLDRLIVDISHHYVCNYKKKRLRTKREISKSRCRKTSHSAHFSNPKTATSDCSSQIIGNNYENRAPHAPVKVYIWKLNARERRTQHLPAHSQIKVMMSTGFPRNAIWIAYELQPWLVHKSNTGLSLIWISINELLPASNWIMHQIAKVHRPQFNNRECSQAHLIAN